MQTLFGAFAFLTRIPMPNHKCETHSTMWAFPIVGSVIGIISSLAYWATISAGLPTMVGATVVIIVHCFLTGALHYDGLGDVADGLWGSHKKARRLEIMKDSRVGSYGVIALVLAILIKIQIISAIGDAYIGDAYVGNVYVVSIALIITSTMSRANLALMQGLCKPAKKDGLMVACGTPSILQGVASMIIGLTIIFALTDVYTVVYIALSCVVIMSVFYRVFLVKIGGITGDCLGATQVLGEIILLMVIYALLNMQHIALGVF